MAQALAADSLARAFRQSQRRLLEKSYNQQHKARRTRIGGDRGRWREGVWMLFALFYVLAITILVMHFTGYLARYNLEWLIYLLAAAVFPAVIFL